MKPARSLLFVPGNKESWLEGAHEQGADIIILDLEDSVPPDEKQKARDLVAECIPYLRARGQRLVVRINGHPGDPLPQTEDDIEVAVEEGVEAIIPPEVRDGEDIEKLDDVVTHIERRDGLEVGSTELILPTETAQAMYNVHEMCSAADRSGSILTGAVKGTDVNRALGFEWTGPGREGLETLHMREKALLDARAAGIEYPFAGTYVDVDDIEGLKQDLQFSYEMGYTGYVVIHPNHVQYANEVFTPDEEELEYWLGLREALQEAKEKGRYSTRYEGDMVDVANLKTANKRLQEAKAYEDDLDIDIDADFE
jgi:citrate lyase subunit beta/citryl-CoA lyase